MPPSNPAAFWIGFALGIAVRPHHADPPEARIGDDRGLLGLLWGVLGLWPFRVGVPPGWDVIRGQTLTTVEQRDEVKPKYWRTEAFTPIPKKS